MKQHASRGLATLRTSMAVDDTGDDLRSTTDDELHSSELNDPQPPVPGERERALVAARAHELGRRRRLVQGGGALAWSPPLP